LLALVDWLLQTGRNIADEHGPLLIICYFKVNLTFKNVSVVRKAVVPC